MLAVSKNDVLRRGPVRGLDRFEPALAALVSQGKVFLNHDAKHKWYICLNTSSMQPVVQQLAMTFQNR